jgi:hypothetical protein
LGDVIRAELCKVKSDTKLMINNVGYRYFPILHRHDSGQSIVFNSLGPSHCRYALLALDKLTEADSEGIRGSTVTEAKGPVDCYRSSDPECEIPKPAGFGVQLIQPRASYLAARITSVYAFHKRLAGHLRDCVGRI